MKHIRVSYHAFAFSVFLSVMLLFAGQAKAASNLDCMNRLPDPQIQTQIEAYETAFSLDTLRQGPPANIVEYIRTLGLECAAEHQWPDLARRRAVFYLGARLTQGAIRRTGIYSSEQHGRLEAALARANDRLRTIAFRSQDSILGGQGAPPVRESDAQFVENMLREARLPLTMQSAHYAGAWIGAVMMELRMRELFERDE